MKISAKGEYAAKAVLHLSLKYPQLVTISEIATEHSIPVKYLEHILLALKRAGLLESRRGVRGGYLLARPPEEISVGEVLRVVDGKFARASCAKISLRERYSCPESDSCGLKQTWEDVEQAVEKILFGTTFDDVRKRTLAGVAGSARLRLYEM
jgi:Rrf2 family protein